MSNELRELGLKAFKRYSQNLTKLHALELDPKIVEYLELREKLDGDANVIKEAAKDNLEGFENSRVKVSVVRNWKKWYDVDIALAEATPQEKKLIEKQCLNREIVKVEFEKLVDENQIRKELKQSAFREEEQSPRVLIKEINDQK